MKVWPVTSTVMVAAVLCISTAAFSQNLAKRLIGTWRLVSTEQRLTNGTIRPSPLYGPTGVGYLIYSASGRICAILTDPTRAHWKSVDSPTDAELRSSFEHFVAYCGRYEVNEEGQFVIHHVEIDVVPNSTGTDLKRYVSFEGNRLKLRPAEPPSKGVVEYTLTWERVGGSAADSTKR